MCFFLQVNTAVKFLQNPKVSASPIQQKQDFLRRKGLTEREVQKACEIASAAGNTFSTQNDYSVTIPPGQNYSHYPQQALQPSLFYKLKELLSGVALIAASCYGIYWLYKVSKSVA